MGGARPPSSRVRADDGGTSVSAVAHRTPLMPSMQSPFAPDVAASAEERSTTIGERKARAYAGAYTVGIRTALQGLFRGKWVETSYKGRNQLQGRYKGESTRPVIHVTGSILEPRLETPKPRFEGESTRPVIHVTDSILEPRLETPKPRFEGESSPRKRKILFLHRDLQFCRTGTIVEIVVYYDSQTIL